MSSELLLAKVIKQTLEDPQRFGIFQRLIDSNGWSENDRNAACLQFAGMLTTELTIYDAIVDDALKTAHIETPISSEVGKTLRDEFESLTPTALAYVRIILDAVIREKGG